MKLITRDTDYALRSLVFMAKNKEKMFSAGQLVKELGIPRPFLRKILQLLHKRNVLRAEMGSGGGFGLAKPADKIFLVELMRIFQGPLTLNECLFKKRICPNKKSCILRKKIGRIEKIVMRHLQSITVASLI